MRRSIKAIAARPVPGAIVLATAVSLVLIASLLSGNPIVIAFSVGMVVWTVVASVVYAGMSLRSLRKEVVESDGSLWGLAGLLAREGRLLPVLGHSAIHPASAHALLDLVIRADARRIVELGPGSSTVLIHLLTDDREDVQIWSVEHDRYFAERFRGTAQYHNLERCHLIESALEDLDLPEWSGRWYSSDMMDGIPDAVDLLIVDGPPNFPNGDNRYPAWPMLRERVVPGGHLFVDDTDRRAERAMVARWIDAGELSIERDGGRFMILSRQ